MQNYFYDLHDQLIKAEIFKKDGTKETWLYTYDALGRRGSKGRLKTENGKEILDSEIAFLWDGSHLLQENGSDGLYTYIYTSVGSYEPLAQIHNYTKKENETYQEINYFHCDQIGIPREITDKDGNLLWFGDYYGWGKLKAESNITNSHQPFRLQNQYCDAETGLHYNFFRYYEPDAGRFVNQDPIGLFGGENFYHLAFNIQDWIDPLGLSKKGIRAVITTVSGVIAEGFSTKAKGKRGKIHAIVQKIYDKVPTRKRSPFHCKCGEPDALSKIAEDADVKTISDLKKIVKNGTSEAYDIADNTLKAPCSSCAWVLKFLGMKGKK